MTIALALSTMTGVVLAADSQETYPGFWKLDTGKIRTIQSTIDNVLTRSCLVSGAGTAAFIDALTERVQHVVCTCPIDNRTLDEHLADPFNDELDIRLGSAVKDFYREHVVPLAVYPSMERPDVQMLIALKETPGRPHIWESQYGTLLKRHTHAAVGSGHLFANTLLAQLGINAGKLDTLNTAVVAGFVVAKVKQSVDGCGQYTDISVADERGTFRVSRTMTERLDALVRQYDQELNHDLLWHVFGDEYVETKQVSRSIRKFRHEFTKLATDMAASGRGPQLMHARQSG